MKSDFCPSIPTKSQMKAKTDDQQAVAQDEPTTSKQIPELFHKQKRFVWEYCKDHVPGAAAIRAGYKEKSANHVASVMLRKPAIRAAVQVREQEIADAALLDEVEIIRGLLREARCTGAGSSHTARVSAWRELAKIRGLEIRRVEVTHHLDDRLAQARRRARLDATDTPALPDPGDAVARSDAVDAEYTEVVPITGGEEEGSETGKPVLAPGLNEGVSD